jgi:hypothetical protein
MTAAPSRIPAAAPAWVRSLVAGPDRPVRVVHRGSDAIYLDVGGSCVGVLSTSATAVPCAARTALPTLPAEVQAAEQAWVGEGRVLLGGSEVVLARTVDAAVPHMPLAEIRDVGARLDRALGGQADHVRAELPEAALLALEVGDPDTVPTLLGRGSGLTPVGDDVLAGWVATAVAGSAPTADETPVAAAVARQAAAMTTLLSATLLDCARRGEVIPQFRALLLSLAAPGRTDVDDALDALLRVGHTSGAGLALGTVLALRHLASRSST